MRLQKRGPRTVVGDPQIRLSPCGFVHEKCRAVMLSACFLLASLCLLCGPRESELHEEVVAADSIGQFRIPPRQFQYWIGTVTEQMREVPDKKVVGAEMTVVNVWPDGSAHNFYLLDTVSFDRLIQNKSFEVTWEAYFTDSTSLMAYGIPDGPNYFVIDNRDGNESLHVKYSYKLAYWRFK